MHILFIIPYPVESAPSQRFRFEQYFEILKKKGWDLMISSFIDDHTWQILYKRRHIFSKAYGILRGFIRRFHILLIVKKYDYVYIHREATPTGPPVFEWIIAKILRKKIIYDFDDAIWLPNTSESNKIIAWFKCHWKVAKICKWAYKISCGNQYLCDYAKQFNENVILNPTTIHNHYFLNELKGQYSGKITIGWTGSHSTLKYLDNIIPVISKLEQKYDFSFMVIADENPKLTLKSFIFQPWREASEEDDLLNLNIGLMPLEINVWSEGKCGLKALQYMALGIPALVSPVGVNKQIVDDGINGFLCTSAEDWFEKIEILLNDEGLRAKMGKAAREKVQKHYSAASNTANFLGLFD